MKRQNTVTLFLYCCPTDLEFKEDKAVLELSFYNFYFVV